MKTFKRFAAAIMIGIMAVSFTACNNDKNDSKSTMTTETVTAESVFDKALENIKNTSSYTATTKVDGTLTGGGVDSNVLVESNIDFIADPLYIKKTVSADEGTGQATTSETYVTVEGDDVHTYNTNGGQWTHQKKTIEQYAESYDNEDIRKDIETILTLADNITMDENTKNDDRIKLTATIPAEKISELINELNAFSYVGFSGYSEESYEGVEPIEFTMYVDSETGNIAEINCNLEKTLQTLIDNIIASFPEGSGVTKLTAEKYTIDIVMSNYNSVEMTEIPEAALSTAVFGS
ncbi:hypothetical protein B5E58_00430 [Tyzzerella sp. An114]|uniref:DUF6612 family protein n=1 Tax=Tyzzerella sp. An114 TaxID=1965545 RepID=UPI000B44B413|nr:DUF6612 family protein [Tyzzerella sp. An114]OUQ60370.1 hypothetical protein B5E58_00430 [Tyzzerella sp. An114]